MTGRLRLLTCIALLVWGAVSIRLVYVQWFRHQPFAEHALAQCALDEVIPARLGDIVDRRGRLLATTSTSNSLYLDPSRITHPDEVAARLADALALDATVLSDRITQSAHRKFLWVKRRLSEVEVRRVIDLDLPRHTWGFREEFLRVYPQGTLSAHVLGWRDIDGLPQSGLERTLDADLQGTPGRRTYVRDARGYVIEVLEEVAQAPRHGGQVTLTIDLAVQRVAEDRLDSLIAQWRPSAASVVAMDPRTGEILAMASRPTFHPARPGDAPPDAWTNHAVASAYEPGSTIKPCVAAWAVD
ncbi:MAG: penicillin-binding protein 2, partial [Planctomycetaceae bacterium]|nr:penicillin-binding protein 2 [Planctomycetaceae bacterium]